MVYNAVDQIDHEKDLDDHEDLDINSTTTSSSQRLSPSNDLFLDAQNSNTRHASTISPTNSTSLSQMVHSITSRDSKTSGSYDLLEEDDFNVRAISPTLSPEGKRFVSRGEGSPPDEPLVLNIPRPRPRQNPATESSNNISSPISPRALLSKEGEPVVRTASGHSIPLRHPTPDLQTLQGAYVGNIDKLERTAERLSMTSSIDDAIRDLHMEQKRSDSRRSSMLSQLNEMPEAARQFSNASSIVEVNNAARSGGYSPAGYMMSPKGSFSATTRGRSASKSSRFGNRPEPDLEGRPLDSFVNSSFPSLVNHRTTSIAEQDESSSTLTRPVVDHLDPQKMAQHEPEVVESRPQTAASTNTNDQAEKMFADFDGTHSGPLRLFSDSESIMEGQNKMAPEPTVQFATNNQRRASSGTQLSTVGMEEYNDQRRVPSENRESTMRPKSYADPGTGQEMVYYPAPVPMMLNLPQKLSKNPSSIARNKRRSEVLNHIPAAARQSAIWLPDVLETNDDPLAENDEAQKMEYIPQHQRMSMGGRRNTRDLEHMPPHLKANAFFELPSHNEVVELKEQSAVATLDSILDASAHAPVSAFVDHAFAGHLGAEVYGKAHNRNSKSSSQLLTPERPDNSKKRTSSYNLLFGRRGKNSLEAGNDKRASTMSQLLERKTTRSPIEDDEDDINNRDTTPLRHTRAVSGGTDLMRADGSDEEEDEGQRDDEIYHGPPTTLLAELQLRKQEQKTRTRPLTSAFPNGVHSTLLEMDTVLQLQQKSRKHKQVNLAWQIGHDDDPNAEDDEDVPLAMLSVAKTRFQERERPLGLMERRELEDNEPLSQRRARLTGQPMPRASTMMHIPIASPLEEEEGETLGQRVKRLKDQGGTATGLPATRPVSGDFASEMMSQFGGDLMKDDKDKLQGESTTPVNEEEETLGQRRKRLQAEREARDKEVGTGGETPEEALVVDKRRSLANLLTAHPAAGAGGRTTSFSKPARPAAGLLGLHEKQSQQRASTMTNLVSKQALIPRGTRLNETQGQPGMMKPSQTMNFNPRNNMAMPGAGFPQYAQPTTNLHNHPMNMGYPNGYANMGYPSNNMNAMGGYNMPMQMQQMQMQMQNYHANSMTASINPGPPDQGQLDMVERWRQSVMY